MGAICCATNEVWSRLEERVPQQITVYEIILQFRSLKPKFFKKPPTFRVSIHWIMHKYVCGRNAIVGNSLLDMRVIRWCGISDGRKCFLPFLGNCGLYAVRVIHRNIRYLYCYEFKDRNIRYLYQKYFTETVNDL